ncbi:MAG: nicotinate phosphoribosyltransferase [Bacilli bacterium]|nr:nicotinate phosphoribosyltransferase [Bacilli bacterium]
MKMFNGYERLPRNYSLLSDNYEHKMGQGYLLNGKKDEMAGFDVFFRRVPNNGGYAIMAGLDKVISFIENLHFGERELKYFKRAGFTDEYIEYMKDFKFTGTIKAIPDGTPVFPNEPLITVVAPLIEAQIVETAILCLVNGAMEHATGARRIIEATPKGVSVMEFGSRRADGTEAAIDSSLYGMMAGCVGTSNDIAADMVNKIGLGTMAHSYIESYPDELSAFKDFAKTYPDNCILLVDTFDTLRSGIPNAIKTYKWMEENGIPTDKIGIRIDSGDLAYLSKEARNMLVEAGFPQAKICLSNGLTAETIETLIAQGAEFDSLGVGDNISKPEGRMGCVYKEIALKSADEWVPKIKLSEDAIKIVNPDLKDLYRAYDKETGYAVADIIVRSGEEIKNGDLILVSPTDYLKKKRITDFTLVPLQQTIFENGKLVFDDPDLDTTKAYCDAQMATIYPEVKRTNNPQIYHVSGTEEYVNFKNELIEEHKALALR